MSVPVVKTMSRVLMAIAAAALAIMMFLVAFDVVMRYVFNRPLDGALELVEYLMAVLVPFSIAYCAEQKGHVAVDLVMDRLPHPVQAVSNFLTSLITVALAVLITWQNIIYIKDTYADRITSAVLLIPAYPFVAAVAIGFGVFSFILIVRCVQSVMEVKTK